MNRFVGMAIALCCVAVGCGEPAESESLKEARKLHDQLTRISGDLHEAMQASLVRIEEEIEASMSAGDSTLAIQLARLESQLGELDVRFHDWESTVVGIPGDACNHDHDHTITTTRMMATITRATTMDTTTIMRTTTRATTMDMITHMTTATNSVWKA